MLFSFETQIAHAQTAIDYDGDEKLDSSIVMDGRKRVHSLDTPITAAATKNKRRAVKVVPDGIDKRALARDSAKYNKHLRVHRRTAVDDKHVEELPEGARARKGE